MAGYPDLAEMDELWPEKGFAVIIEDEMKPPDSDDFVTMLSQFDSPDFDLPSESGSYSYWVHDEDGNRYERDEWKLYRSKQRLTEAVQTVSEDQPVEEQLEKLKQKGKERGKRDDVIWFEIVVSLCTLGGSWGAETVVDDGGQIDEHKYGSLAFETLQEIDQNLLDQYLESRLSGNVRMHPTKAEAIEENFKIIRDRYGDPLNTKQLIQQKDTPEEIIEFFKQFHWIGDKYARNIPMDLHLEEFHDYIAVDSRIKGILETADYPVEERKYAEIENFLREVASELDMTAWELDRILYNFEDSITSAIISE